MISDFVVHLYLSVVVWYRHSGVLNFLRTILKMNSLHFSLVDQQQHCYFLQIYVSVWAMLVA